MELRLAIGYRLSAIGYRLVGDQPMGFPMADPQPAIPSMKADSR